MTFRRTTLGLGAAMFLAGTMAAQAQGTLNLYNWGNYTSPELLERFEAETGIRVVVTDYDSNDTALARIQAGGHGFDIVVPSNTHVPIWIEEGLVAEIDTSIVTNMDNIARQWRDVPFDPGRRYSVPWAWGTTGVTVNTDMYSGDINTAEIFIDPPEELRGRINIIPEMADIMTLTLFYIGDMDACSTNLESLRKVRDLLTAAKPHWLSMDYGNEDNYAAGDIGAGVWWNGSSMRARLLNPAIQYGYPVTGYPIWMDNAMVLADARNKEAAMKFINFILEPENAALISNFARYANGIAGSEPFLDAEMKDAPEIVVPEEFVSKGIFTDACSADVVELHSQVWTELLQ